jgi:hypothetical protein
MRNFVPSSRRLGLLSVGLLFVALRANAQPRDPAAAQALFDEARKLTAQGRYAEACAKLDESNRLDPGIGTQFHLADCQEKSGRIASAWATFLEVASQARASGQGDREKAALKRAGQLESRIPKLRIDVPEANRVSGLEIRRDGMLVGAAQWGSPVPVDPGEHELVATAPGKRTLSQKIRTEAGKTANLELPMLEDDPGASSAAAPSQTFVTADDARTDPATGSAPSSTAPGPRRDDSTGGQGTNPLVFVLAGVGVVGVGLGATFALMAGSTNDDSKALCQKNEPNRCSQAGVDMRDDALAQGNVATVAFIAGGAALAGAGIWFLIDGGGSEKAESALAAGVAPKPGGATLVVRGGF